MLNPGHYLDTMRRDGPLVHNITNYVAMNVMANVLLAAGAAPAMVHAREEAAEFAGLARALTVNIGTADPEWGHAMAESAAVMNDAGKPWVLDPVGVGATAFRRDLSARLVEMGPTVVRGNASEIMTLAGEAGRGRGVDAGDDVSDAQAAAQALATRTGGVVAVTGTEDYVTDGTRALRITGGHPLMGRVTVMGCSLTGVIAAFCAGGESPFESTAAALAYYGLAGQRAAAKAQGPGTFQVHFLDELHAVTAGDVDAAAPVHTA
ncbi:hydroxyethylthiazole kinase [Roseovarius salinarum]|uniref:hydroxyethylthiazole kinase n=1 Tax=Roseovarius salinarum TaxID=1981892 RepID=UPI000C31C3B3|nr:hydroxyethylthiazole kinase [Roseovarius salinarum]